MDRIAKYSVKTADALIHTGPALLLGFVVMPDGTNDVTVIPYDQTSAAVPKALPSLVFPGDEGPQALALPAPLRCDNGIYIDITTAGTVEYAVLYTPR